MKRVTLLMTLCLSVQGGPWMMLFRPTVNIPHYRSYDAMRSIIPDPSLPPPAARRKPLCGPIRIPNVSCEELTTCRPVPTPKDGNNDLHQQAKTVCLPITIESKNPNHPSIARSYNEILRQKSTTSTMAPYVQGTPPKIEQPPPEKLLKCEKVANCREHKW